MTKLQPLDRCWLIPRQPPVFCVLGRYGDLILLLPAFLEIYRRTGLKPIVIVSHEYASVLDGVSYVVPDVVKDGWWSGIPKARQMAERKYGRAIVPHWWNDPATAGDLVEDIGKSGVRVLQSHGINWGVDTKANPDFATSMWRRAGFTREEMFSLPMVFDRRSPEREEFLVKQYAPSGRKLLLYNFTGQSAPFPYTPEVGRLLSPYRSKFTLVDLGAIRAHRIYDLLGLYDKADGLISCDTATAHLSHASSVPTIWFTNDGWAGAAPHGNVALHIKYSEVPKRLGEIPAIVNQWLTK